MADQTPRDQIIALHREAVAALRAAHREGSKWANSTHEAAASERELGSILATRCSEALKTLEDEPFNEVTEYRG